jgi:ribonuclease-3
VAEADDPLAQLEDALGHRFRDRSFLSEAVTHSSYAHEASRQAAVSHNERLEFLGDSILNFLVAEMLLEAFPDLREGPLSKARSHLVSEAHFSKLARSLGLGDVLRLAEGEQRSGGRVKDSILADAFEAVVAAVYEDAGMEAARSVARRLFAEDISNLDPGEQSFHDHKTALQELAQSEGRPLPAYRLLSESGPDHARVFVYEVEVEPGIRATGEGPSKKEAQRQAAKKALAEKLGPPKGGPPKGDGDEIVVYSG